MREPVEIIPIAIPVLVEVVAVVLIIGAMVIGRVALLNWVGMS